MIEISIVEISIVEISMSRFEHRVEDISVFCRPGSDLLFQALRLSTIGAGEFNGRVRDGIGFRLSANTTRSAKDGNEARMVFTRDRSHAAHRKTAH